MSRPYGDPFDLAPRFAELDQCPPVVKALLVTHASHMITSLMANVRLLGSRPAAFKRQSADPAISARYGISRRGRRSSEGKGAARRPD